MKTATALVALFLLAWLSACVPVTPSTLSISPIATPNPVEAFVNANSSQATAVAAVSTAQFYAGELTATVQSQQITATQSGLGPKLPRCNPWSCPALRRVGAPPRWLISPSRPPPRPPTPAWMPGWPPPHSMPGILPRPPMQPLLKPMPRNKPESPRISSLGWSGKRKSIRRLPSCRLPAGPFSPCCWWSLCSTGRASE